MLAVPPPSPRRVAKVAVVVMLAGAPDAVFERFEHTSSGGREVVFVAFLFLAVGTVYAFLWALWKTRKESKGKRVS
jgi:hypothetical protein